MQDILILNTGGTFNKVYNPLTGELDVPCDNSAVEHIVELFEGNVDIKIEGLIYKDSLAFSPKDRELLATTIKSARAKKIIVVHGTDTMHKSAKKIAKLNLEKCVVFTGSMVPFSINPAEAIANLCMAIALKSKEGVYISMQGLLGRYNEIYKDKEAGVFRWRK